ncbi:MAG: MerR family transcriptional regulator [Acutalibacteraceae bacterium]
MKTVHEVSNISGVSIRTLHHYDAIGLLKPTELTQSGYRLYDDAALERLQSILLFRELGFPLKDIRVIIDSPVFDKREALRQQIKLLELKRKQIDGLISLAQNIIDNGGNKMDFSAFDKREQEQYAKEAKERWGGTSAYAEYETRVQGKSDGEQIKAADGLMRIFAEMGKIKNSAPDSVQAQAIVKKLQQYITDNYYTCTPQILSSLGAMYTGDERFKQNIDSTGGEGTAEFTALAIEAYVNKI